MGEEGNFISATEQKHNERCALAHAGYLSGQRPKEICDELESLRRARQELQEEHAAERRNYRPFLEDRPADMLPSMDPITTMTVAAAGSAVGAGKTGNSGVSAVLLPSLN